MTHERLLRILVVDDVRLIASCVASRIRRAAEQSDLPDCRVATVDFLVIRGGGGGAPAAAALQATILEKDINVLVVDRGIAHELEEETKQEPNGLGAIYYRRRDVAYDFIEDILAEVGALARDRIETIVLYTLDDPKHGSTWYVDDHAVRARLRQAFKHPIICLLKTNSEVYGPTGLKLFNPDSRHGCHREIAHGPDLQLYGAIVGEMAWRNISASVLRGHAAHRLGLRKWLLRNFFVFALITFGLGVGISAAYDLLKGSVPPAPLLLVSVLLGVVVPFLLLNYEPRLLMLPGAEEE